MELAIDKTHQPNYLSTSDLAKLTSLNLIHFANTSNYLVDDAKELLKLRLGNVSAVSNDTLKQEYGKERYPQWFKVLIIEELERREAFHNKKANAIVDSAPTVTYKSTSDLAKMKVSALIHWVETSDYLVADAKEILLQRFGNVGLVKEEILQKELANPQRPAWYKELIKLEVNRREGLKDRKRQQQQQRATYKAQQSKHSLLEASKQHSIFKIKFQYANGIHYISTQYSRDYVAERQALEKLSKQELEFKLDAQGEFSYELFDDNGLREKAFNGFKYSLQIFDKLRKEGKICFFGIFLNKIKETHSNGEAYSRTIYRWGEWKKQEL